MNKILFLDFDGVLGPRSQSLWKTTPEAIAAKKQVRRIIDETGAYVVVTSSYRASYSVEQLGAMLAEYNVVPSADRVIDKTSSERISLFGLPLTTRGDQIWDWVTQHSAVIDDFVILDDKVKAIATARSKFIQLQLAKRYVKPESTVGCTQGDADVAIELLNGIY